MLDNVDPKGAGGPRVSQPPIYAFPEVADDLQAIANAKDAATLLTEIRHRVDVLRDPRRTSNEQELDAFEDGDLSDCMKQKVGVRQRKGKNVLRWIYQRRKNGDYVVVIVGTRHNPSSEVYEESYARLGRGPEFVLTDGTDITVLAAMEINQRKALWTKLGISLDPIGSGGELYFGRRVNEGIVQLTDSPAYEDEEPYTDHLVLGWDEENGREADIEFYEVIDALDRQKISYIADW